jgi:hypothetical protein
MDNEQMRRQIRTDILKAEILEKERHMIFKYQANLMRRIREMEESENMLRAALTNYLNDSSNESDPDGGDGDDPAEHKSWYYTAGHELTESTRNPYWE